MGHIISKHSFKDGKNVKGRKYKGKTLTVPNRVMSLRKLAERFASGLDDTLDHKIALYDEGRTVIKDFERLDLVERQEIVKDAMRQLQELKNKKQLMIQESNKGKLAALVQAEVDKRLKEEDDKRKSITSPQLPAA